jgi:ADP-ribose pyrophosphatase YjhB (NUDIX family)
MNKKKIIAAGGLVLNEQKEILLIFRRGKWDLPKGKLDDNETITACAVREVEEETGLKNITLGNFITKTNHEYFDKWINEEVIKETWWYEMFASNNEQLIPQTEEDIEQIIWSNTSTVQKCLLNTYPNIIEVIDTYFSVD